MFSTLAWGMLEFRAGYVKAGALDKGLEHLKYAAEFMIRSHISENQFAAQVGAAADADAAAADYDDDDIPIPPAVSVCMFSAT